MARQQKMITKKRGRGRPATGINPLIGVRLPPELLSAIDEYIEKTIPGTTRPEAVRRLIDAALSARPALRQLIGEIDTSAQMYEKTRKSMSRLRDLLDV